MEGSTGAIIWNSIIIQEAVVKESADPYGIIKIYLESDATWRLIFYFCLEAKEHKEHLEYPVSVLHLHLALEVNGILEAFVHMSQEFVAFDQSMIVFSILYAIIVYILMSQYHLGTIGLILANCKHMTCRIRYMLLFVH